ncbi:MAG: 2-hydroxychromene-2-carboxylate isomerase [Myxococcota bacterium]|nr:2-hydroxychromene-2-carboxylate isomerase [Myxococcota bacterium]
MTERTIELFYDVGSPYTYLAMTQVESLEARLGATVRLRPFLLGGVFKATGNAPPAQVAAKARWMGDDLERWAAHYGVPYELASRFPLNTLSTQRALAAADLEGGQAALRALTMPLFRALWVDDRDVSAPEVIADVASAAGLDGASLIARASQDDAKQHLRVTTEEAIARGAFGSPSFFVGDQLFFGNDRIPLIEALFASR